jgi:circadian clock protein KaiB
MSRRAKYKFRLYVADHTPNSVRAIANLAALGREHLPGEYEIEVVDVLKEPERAEKDSIFLTPTLVVMGSVPPIRIVGTLSQADTVLEALGLQTPGLAAEAA